MSRPQLEVLLETEGGYVTPGARLRGGLRLLTPEPVAVSRVELSLVWRTEGKGDPDTGVAHLESVAENSELDSVTALPFDLPLPLTPWSYNGTLIKIIWALRVRVFTRMSGEISGEELFTVCPAERRPAAK